LLQLIVIVIFDGVVVVIIVVVVVALWALCKTTWACIVAAED